MLRTLLRRATVATLDGVTARARRSNRAAVRVVGSVLDDLRARVGLDKIGTRSPIPDWDGSQPDQPMWPSDRERLHKHRVAQGIIPADGEQKAAPPKPAVEVYLKRGCPYTRAAIELLREREIEFIERDVTDDEALQGWLRNVTGRKTTPQIFLHDQSIGGFDELRELDQSGELRARLERGKPEPTPKRPRKLPVLGAHPERSPFEGEVELPEVSASERLEGDALIARVREVLDELRPMVQSDGGDIELLDVRDDTVSVSLTGNCVGCPSSQATLRHGIERRLRQQIPQLRGIRSPQLDRA